MDLVVKRLRYKASSIRTCMTWCLWETRPESQECNHDPELFNGKQPDRLKKTDWPETARMQITGGPKSEQMLPPERQFRRSSEKANVESAAQETAELASKAGEERQARDAAAEATESRRPASCP